MRLKSLRTMALLLTVFANTSYAETCSKNISLNCDQQEQISSVFMRSSGRVSTTKLYHYREKIISRYEQLKSGIINERTLLKGKSLKNAKKKAEEKLASYKDLLEELDALKSAQTKSEKYMHAQNALELSYSLKNEGNLLVMTHVRKAIPFILRSYFVEGKNAKMPEASNLGYSQEELQSMKRRNKDLSLLNPKQATAMEIKSEKKISDHDVYSFHRPETELYKGVRVRWPKENVFEYDEVRLSQSKFKIDVEYDEFEDGKKEVYKLKLGSELHSEVTSSALGQALGLHTDLSRYVRRPKLVFKNNEKLDEFYALYNQYYSQLWGDIRDDDHPYIAERGEVDGKPYIIFTDGLLEHKFKQQDEIKRVGPWGYGALGHQDKRDIRALYMFNVWVANNDLKEAENNKLITRKVDGKLKLFHVQQDMGFSFGNILRERPLDFPWDVVKRVSRDGKIVFQYRNFQFNSKWFENVTYSDAKWFVRRIAALSSKQIDDAVTIGGWPTEYQIRGLIAAKLKYRRDDLVKAFDLVGKSDADGNKIELFNISKKDYRNIKIPEHIDGYSLNYSKEMDDLLQERVLGSLSKGALNAARAGANAFKRIAIDSMTDGFGVDDFLIAKVLFNNSRNIVVNKATTSRNDQYIVKDSLTYGLRGGAGTIVSADTAILRRYSLIYTEGNYHKAQTGDNFIVNFNLLNKEYRNNFEKPHILISDNELEFRGRIKLVPLVSGVGMGPGIQSHGSVVRLGRVIMARKGNGKITLVKDYSNIKEIGAAAFVQLGVLKTRFAESFKQNAKLTSEIFEISESSLKRSSSMQKAVRYAMEKHDFSYIRKLVRPTTINSDFIEKQNELKFLFWGKNKRLRVDDYKITTLRKDKNGKNIVERKLDVKLNKETWWSFFANGESRREDIGLVTDINRNRRLTNLGLTLAYTVEDKHAKAREVDGYFWGHNSVGYIDFLNGVTPQKMINFTAADHFHRRDDDPKASRPVGHIISLLNIEFSEKAVRNLLRTTEEQLLARVRQLSTSKRKSKGVGTSRRGSQYDNYYVYKGIEYKASTVHSAIDKFTDYRNEAFRQTDFKKMGELLAKGLDAAVKRKDHSYSALVLRAMIDYANAGSRKGREEVFIQAMVRVPTHVESKMPEKITWYNEWGQKQDEGEKRYVIGAAEAHDIWHNF